MALRDASFFYFLIFIFEIFLKKFQLRVSLRQFSETLSKIEGKMMNSFFRSSSIEKMKIFLKIWGFQKGRPLIIFLFLGKNGPKMAHFCPKWGILAHLGV